MTNEQLNRAIEIKSAMDTVSLSLGFLYDIESKDPNFPVVAYAVSNAEVYAKFSPGDNTAVNNTKLKRLVTEQRRAMIKFMESELSRLKSELEAL